MTTPTIEQTHFQFPGQTDFYSGKVRDVYEIQNKYLVMVASDRISAFDTILPRPIPCKGQVLNQIAAKFLEATQDIVPNWVVEVPDPNVTIGLKCEPYPVEMVVRNYLAGHAWRVYDSGKREICGQPLPDGLNQHDKLPKPILTPATKALEGHDEDISPKEIIEQELMTEPEFEEMKENALRLFERGTEMARDRGLLLVDTKYEFGRLDGKITLIDEVHTPDSSRYFYAEGYEKRQQNGEPQKQLSKEFVREWLMEQGYQGKEGQEMPEFTDVVVQSITDRYIELYEQLTGEDFQKRTSSDLEKEIERNTREALDTLVVIE